MVFELKTYSHQLNSVKLVAISFIWVKTEHYIACTFVVSIINQLNKVTKEPLIAIAMKTILSILVVLCMATNLQACTSDDSSANPSENNETDNGNNSNQNTEDMKIKIICGDTVLTATLTNNATSRAFVEKLPVTLPMLDLYSREMCYRFPDALPANEATTRGYEVGEIIYYPPRHSFVIMYAQNGERFNMQSIGRVDANVEAFKNIGNIEVRFELAENE